MSQDYDKIFKENINALLKPLADKLLGIKIKKVQPLKDKLQDTLESEADFLNIVETSTGERFILHLEFQTDNDPKMVYRMQLYFSLMKRKYNLPVIQKVLYFGSKPSQMKTRLSSDEIFSGFDLVEIGDHSYKDFLTSEIPEELILSILSDFEERPPETIIEDILKQLNETKQNQAVFKKYVRQLIILSRLRGLSQLIKNAIQDMPITYDIKEDAFFKEGLEKGLERGLEKGLERGLDIGLDKSLEVIKLIKQGKLSLQEIAEFTSININTVKSIAAELNK